MEREGRLLKMRHLGIAGALTVIAQYFIGLEHREMTRIEIQAFASRQMETMQRELAADKLAREKDFVRKSDMSDSLGRIDGTLNLINGKVDSVADEVSEIRGYLNRKESEQVSVIR